MWIQKNLSKNTLEKFKYISLSTSLYVKNPFQIFSKYPLSVQRDAAIKQRSRDECPAETNDVQKFIKRNERNEISK